MIVLRGTISFSRAWEICGGGKMEIVLYKTNSDKRVLNKSLTIVETVSNVNLLDNCSIINPTFVLSNADWRDANYIYCGDFNRYYFVNDVELRNGQLLYIRCTVDVLMSFKQDILNADCIINRASDNFNVLIDDSVQLKQANAITVNKLFSGGEFLSNGISASNRSFLLSVFGGVL